MTTPWDKYIQTAISLTEVPRRRAETIVKSLVKQGELAAERAEKSVDDLLRLSEANRKAVIDLVRAETERAVARLGLANKSDLERLERRLAHVEQETGLSEGGSAPAEGGGSPAADRARETAAQTTAKRAAKGAPAAPAPPASRTAKSTAARTTAAAAKKAAAKKAAAKKAAGKRTTKKSAAERRAVATAAERTAEATEQSTAAHADPPAEDEA